MYSVQDTLQAEWVSPFGNPRVKACLSAHRGLSQTTTSFIASYCLGIHHVRLVTWPYNSKNFWVHCFNTCFLLYKQNQNNVNSIVQIEYMSCNMCKCDTWLNQHIVDPLKTSEISKLLKNKIIKTLKIIALKNRKQQRNQNWWWSQAGSNRRPPACKAGALPAELWPHGLLSIMHLKIYLVGLGRFELPTSPLSGVRSNQLSYRPKNTSECLVALRAKLGKFQGCCCYQITCEGTRIFVFWLLFAL